MATKTTHSSVSGRMINVIGCVMVSSILLFTGGCRKKEAIGQSQNTQAPVQLNETEKALVGDWILQRTETYEVAGTDSAGNCVCNLLSTNQCDTLCTISFFNCLVGIGSVKGCGYDSAFQWNIHQSMTLQTGNSLFHIDALTHDSVVFSQQYKKDILDLRSEYHYRRK